MGWSFDKPESTRARLNGEQQTATRQLESVGQKPAQFGALLQFSPGQLQGNSQVQGM